MSDKNTEVELEFVAVACDQKTGEVTSFDKAQYFRYYLFKNGKKKKMRFLSLFPDGPEDLAKTLQGEFVDVVICRNYSPRALNVLKKAKMEIYSFNGGPDAAVKAWAAGELKPYF